MSVDDPVPESIRKVGAMRIFRRTFFTTAAMHVTAAVRAAGPGAGRGVSRFRTTPRVVCGLPDHDYVHGGARGPALGVSLPALLLPVRDAAQDGLLPSGRRAYYYQMDAAELRVDHCSISRVSLAVRDDGYWTLSLRADQNLGDGRIPPLIAVGRPSSSEAASPAPSRVLLPGATATGRFTEHIKRNLFIVKVRGYAAFAIGSALDAPPSRPVLFQLSPPPFWVQRRETIFPKFQDASPEAAEFVRSADRVEVELSYR
jgi:hypothetical protein